MSKKIWNHSCSQCPKLCGNANTICIRGKGPRNPDLMVIGEAPGADEDREGEPYIGQAGRYLKKSILAPLHIDPAECYIDNAVRCRPPKNRKPTRIEVMHCRPYLEQVIKAVKPKVLVLTGNTPLCSVMFLDKNTGITRWRGKPMWSSEFNCWVIATFHPSGIMRQTTIGRMAQYDQTLSDFKKALEMVHWDPPAFQLPETQSPSTMTKIVQYIKRAVKVGLVAVDLETASLDPRDEILGVSMTYKKEGIYYPVYIDWKHFEAHGECIGALRYLLKSPDVIKVFQNIDFDWRFLHSHKCEVAGPLEDTMIMAHLLDENFSVGLKQRTWTELTFGGYDIPLEKYKLEHKFTKKTSYREIPFETMAPYAGGDTVATMLLYEKFVPMLKEQKLWPLYSRITMPVRRVMTGASINGIYVDMKTADALEKRIVEAQKILTQQIWSVVEREIKFTSSIQLGKYFFDELNAPGGKKTKANNWICDKDVLIALANKSGNRKYSKVAALTVKYKYLDKCRGTYIGQARTFQWEDQRVHSQYNSTGTVTGRVSNSKPCTHNIPRDRLIRSLYGATPGNTIVEADIKAAEMRAIALESGDEVLLRIIHSGKDIHNMTYNEMFSKEEDYTPTDPERRISKAINFGLIYGITAVGLARRLGVSTKVAQAYIDAYFDRFRGVARWLRKTVQFARKHGYVVSLFKRRRRLPNINSDDKFERYSAERQGMNAPIQSEAADFTYIGLIRVDKMLKEAKLEAKIIHTVHDCLLVDTPMHEVKQVKAIIRKAFSMPVKAFPMEMQVDIEVNERWGADNESKLGPMLDDILEAA